MCGLLGLAFNGEQEVNPHKAAYLVTQLMNANESRGGDSYGVALINPDAGTVTSYKYTGRITKDAYNKSWQRMLRDLQRRVVDKEPVILLGHNRKATTGAVTVRNSHPFVFGAPGDGKFVAGAHNGWLSDWSKIKDHLDIKNEIQVDSEVIFRAVQRKLADKEDPKQTVYNMDEHGAVAVTWVDDRDLWRLHFYRGTNPLSAVRVDNMLVWSSTDHHLASVTLGMVDPKKITTLSRGQYIGYDVANAKVVEGDVGTGSRFFAYIGGKGSAAGRPYSGAYSSDEHDWWENTGRAAPSSRQLPSSGTVVTSSNNSHLGMVGVAVFSRIESNRKQDKCLSCDETGNRWEFLWVKDVPMCSVCYYMKVLDPITAQAQSNSNNVEYN